MLLDHMYNVGVILSKTLLFLTSFAYNLELKMVQFDCNNFPNQWEGYHSLEIGILVDRGFMSRFDDDEQVINDYLSMMLDRTNLVFSSQFNVHIGIGTILMGNNIKNYGNLPPNRYWWNDGKNLKNGCKLSQDQLKNIRTWLASKYDYEANLCKKEGYNTVNCPYTDHYATWVYLCDCYPGNGMAPVGTLCWKDSFNAAVVNYEQDETWLSFVHELGHIFGESHYFDDGNGGLMDYDEQQYNQIYQFRHGNGICNGINNSQKTIKESPNASNSNKANCWKNDNEMRYIWSGSLEYTSCYPKCGKYRHKSQKVVCKMFKKNSKFQVVNDKYCDKNTKPLPIFSQCIDEQKKMKKQPKEAQKECPEINTKKDTRNIITAAFMDKKGHEYVFFNNKYRLNDDKDNIQSISVLFPTITDKYWLADFDAIFSTIEDIVYIIKKKEYIRYDLDKNVLIDTKPIKIKPRNHECEFGYIPTIFWSCEKIDAAFRISNHQIMLICDTLGYIFNMKIKGQFDNMYRPFLLDIGLTDMYYKVTAGVYNFDHNLLNLYIIDEHLKPYLLQIHLKNDQEAINGLKNFVIDQIDKKPL